MEVEDRFGVLLREINLHAPLPVFVLSRRPSVRMFVDDRLQIRVVQAQTRLPFCRVVRHLGLVEDEVRVVVDAVLVVHQGVGSHHEVPHLAERAGALPPVAGHVLPELHHETPEEIGMKKLEREPGPSPVHVALVLVTQPGLQLAAGPTKPQI